MRVGFRLSFLAVIFLMVGAPVAAAQQDACWKLVHGKTQQYGQLSLDRIGEVYLQRWTWEKVAAPQFQADEVAPLLVVGSVTDNAVVAQLAGAALQRDGERWLYHGRALEPGYGLVIGGRRGAQPFCIMTGLDDEAVYQCFTTNVDLSSRRSFVVRQSLVYQNWAWPTVNPASADARRPLVHDPASLVLPMLQPWEKGASGVDLHRRTEQAARLLSGYAGERQLIGVDPRVPVVEGVRQALLDLQTRDHARLRELQAWATDVDLAAMVSEVFAQVEAAYGSARQAAPAVYLLLDSPHVTNARTVGFDASSGRPRVVMNLACFASERVFRLTLAHEFVHVLQLDAEGKLVEDPTVVEGVASFLSGRLFPEVSTAEVLMWSEVAVQEAQAVSEQAAKDFKQLRAERPELLGTWFTLGQEPQSIDGPTGYPDRMGYYLGWHAARGWWMLRDQPQAASLLRLGAGGLLDFMPDKVTIRDR